MCRSASGVARGSATKRRSEVAFLRRNAATSRLADREEAFRVLRSNLLVAISDLANNASAVICVVGYLVNVI